MDMIYALYCPVAKIIRYIGKTNDLNRRLKEHIKGDDSADYYCARWVRGLVERGLVPQISLLYQVPEGQRWQDAETKFIRMYREAGYPLTNCTDGGDGWQGFKPPPFTPERKAKMSESKKKWMAVPENKEFFIEVMNSPARVEKISASAKRRNADPAVQAIIHAPASQAKQSQSLKETWARRKKAMKEEGAEKEFREMCAARNRASWADPEQRARREAAQRNPEVNARRSESLRQAHARRKLSQGVLANE